MHIILHINAHGLWFFVTAINELWVQYSGSCRPAGAGGCINRLQVKGREYACAPLTTTLPLFLIKTHAQERFPCSECLFLLNELHYKDAPLFIKHSMDKCHKHSPTLHRFSQYFLQYNYFLWSSAPPSGQNAIFFLIEVFKKNMFCLLDGAEYHREKKHRK